MCLPCHLLLVPCNAWASCELSCTHHQECMGNAWEFMDFFQCYGCSTSGNTHCKGGYIINPRQYTHLGLGWTTVEKCICRSRISVKDKVVWGDGLVWQRRWTNFQNIIPQVGVLWRPSLWHEGLRLPKKLDLWRISIAESVAMLVTMSFFHSCLKFFNG